MLLDLQQAIEFRRVRNGIDADFYPKNLSRKKYFSESSLLHHQIPLIPAGWQS